jgi:hypothetical protein
VATDTSSVSYYDAANNTWYTPSNTGSGTPALLRTASGNNQTSAGPINTVGANLIVVSGSNGAVSDSANNTWTRLASDNYANLLYCTNPITSANHTFSILGNSAFFQVAVFVNANGANNISASGNTSAGPANTIVANELVVAVVGWGASDNITGCTMSGFTQASGTLDNGTYGGTFLFYTVKASPGSITATPALTGGTPYGQGVVMGSFLP